MAGTVMAAGLVAGAAIDAVVGDPAQWHPVAGFGRIAGAVEGATHRDSMAVGTVATTVLVGGAVAATVTLDRALPRWARPAWMAVVTASALGGTTLRGEARAMAAVLRAGDLDAARHRLPALCGRDPSELDEKALVRATVESVAENTSDATVGTLAWGAAVGPAGVVGHRAANTLDAMIGYRSQRYARFGRAAARLDDALNLVPARITAGLTVLLAPTVGGSRRDAWRAWRRDAPGHPSPNAGPVEAAMAGALGVSLGGGTNRYGDHQDTRPSLGDGPPPTVADLDRAIALSGRVSLAALVLAGAAAILRRPRTKRAR